MSRAGKYTLIPENFADWRMDATKINGRIICTARRTGVTLQLIRETDGWWTVTKWHQGRETYSKRVRRLPYDAATVIDQQRRRQLHEARQYARLDSAPAVQ